MPSGPRSIFEKGVFEPFLTHFWSQNGPFSRHFGIFHGPKRVTTGSKWAKNTCLSIPSGIGTTLEKIIFSPRGPLVDPLLAPTVPGPSCLAAPPSDHWCGGLGISLGDSEAWKPQKVGGCGWNRCPTNSVLSHIAQDTARSWFWACLAQMTHIQATFSHFWAVSRTYRGVRKQQRALGHGEIKAHMDCCNCSPSFGRFEWVLGPFGAKKGCFGAQNAQFWEGTSRLSAPAPGRHL